MAEETAISGRYPSDRAIRQLGPVGVAAVFALLVWASLVSDTIPTQMAVKRSALAIFNTFEGYTCYVGPNSVGAFTIKTEGGNVVTVASTFGKAPICMIGAIK